MIVSGTRKRSIYKQESSFSWSSSFVGVDVDYCSFGFSGASGRLSWLISGGKVFDQSGLLLNSVDFSDNSVSFSGNVSSGRNDLYVNGSPVYIGRSKSSNGYEWLFFDVSSGESIEADFFVNSTIPDHSFSSFDSFHSGEMVSVQLVNNAALPFKVFSGYADSSSFTFFGPTNYDIAPNQTGTLYLSSNGFFSKSTFNLALFTNFGDIAFNFTADPIAEEENPFFISFGPEINSLKSNVESDHVITFYNRAGALLDLSLEYVSGVTGDIFGGISQERFISGQPVSGFLSGSGYLTGINTGYVVKYNDLLGRNETGTATGILYQRYTATGTVSYMLPIRIPIMGTGYIQSLIPASGYREISGSGYISRFKKYIDVSGVTGYMTGYSENGEQVITISSGFSRVDVNYDYDSIPIYVNLKTGEYELKSF